MRPFFSVSPMRATCLAAVLAFGSAGQALAAADPCMRPAEKVAFDLARLKGELMVTAITCQVQDNYNSFVMRFRSDLLNEEKALNDYFNRTAGRRAQQAHDDYITTLANTQSEDGLQNGTQFCDSHVHLFNDVMALKDSKDLAAFAAAQTMVQVIALVECPTAPATKVKTAAAK